jgi:hypothetical protein
VLKVTRNLVFCQGMFRVDGEPVLRTDAIVKPLAAGTAGKYVARRHFEDGAPPG